MRAKSYSTEVSTPDLLCEHLPIGPDLDSGPFPSHAAKPGLVPFLSLHFIGSLTLKKLENYS